MHYIRLFLYIAKKKERKKQKKEDKDGIRFKKLSKLAIIMWINILFFIFLLNLNLNHNLISFLFFSVQITLKTM